eukprot:Tamp_01159.p1 GENE.Tamp_01159~~Tamp_01159.p1  ORF type:complete len:1786 (+),score=166.12 Tamp_01159:358-5358(+)
MPIFDINLSKRNKAFLARQERKRPFTAHVAGGPYESRYLLHAFSGYEVAACPTRPAWSLGGKSHLDWLIPTSDAPGPGAYDILEVDKMNWLRAAAPKFGKADQRISEFYYEEKEAEQKPGPGNYNTHLSWVAPTVIKDFGSEPARPLSHKEKEVLSHPGPGAYETAVAAETLGTSGAFLSFGKEQQRPTEPKIAHDSDLPGPGQYPRVDDWITCRGLGGVAPLSDHVRSRPVKVGIGFGFGSKTAEPTPADLDLYSYPAPGTYYRPGIWGSDLNCPTGSRYSYGSKFGREEQRPMGLWELAQLALPDYNAYYKPLRWDEGGHVFGKDARTPTDHWLADQLAQVPGPGMYENGPAGLGHGGYLFGREAQRLLDAWQKEQANMPGVGEYDPQVPRGCFVNDGVSFPREPARQEFPELLAVRALEPGPGTYDPPPGATTRGVSYADIAMSFTRETQRPNSDEDKYLQSLPGPGTYAPAADQNLEHHFKHFESGPKHSFPKEVQRPIELQVRNGVKLPGPGQYVMRQDAAGGGGAVGVAWTPASGVHDGRGKNGWFLGGVPMATFGAQLQRPLSIEEEEGKRGERPGPGQYATPSSLSATGAPIFGKEEKCPVAYEERVLLEVPGPGEYDPKDPWGGFTQAKGALGPAVSFSFPRAEREPPQLEDRPGPGQYTLRKDLEQDYVDSLWRRTGVEKRAVIGDHWLPGAAPFDRQTRDDKTTQKRNGSIPGVGQYHIASADAQVMPVGPAVSIPKEQQRPLDPAARAATVVPGPGTYSPQDSASTLQMQQQQAQTIGDEKRTLEPRAKAAAQVPGVGQYSHEMPDDMGSTALWNKLPKGQSFTKESMRPLSSEEREQQNVPGVGAYGGSILAPDPRWAHEPFATFGSEEQRPAAIIEKSRIQVPGVGAYDVEGPRIKSASAVFGTEDARPADVSERARAQVPGVGAYDLYEMGGRDHSWSITTPQEIRAPSYTFAREFENTRFMYPQNLPGFGTPGAGRYETIGRVRDGGSYERPQIRIPQASRGGGIEDAEPTPGPGAYDTAGNLESLDHGVSFKGAGTERDGVRGDLMRGREADQVPGSGAYDVGGGGDSSRVSIAQGGRVPVISTAMGYEEQRPADATESYLSSVPGPGEYDTQGLSRRGREEPLHVPVIGTEPRNTSGIARDSGLLPGPGSHDTVGRHHEWGRKTGREGFAFGREAQRVSEPALVEASQNPGPGAYEAAATLGPDVQGWLGISMGQRQEISGLDGPGGEFPRVGPGSYDVSGRTRDGWGQSPAIGFTRGLRGDFAGADLQGPGPGEYDVGGLTRRGADQQEGIDFAHGAPRGDIAPDQGVPGPGAYEAKETLETAKGTAMGFGTRVAMTPQDVTPGPGLYSLPTTLEERTTNFGAAAVRGSHGVMEGDPDLPGPGEYEAASVLLGHVDRAPPAPGLTSGHRSSITSTNAHLAPRAEPEQAPGPGDYDTRDLVRDGGHVSARQSDFARGAAGGLNLMGDLINVPGPGAYDPPHSSFEPFYSAMGQGGAGKFGTERRVFGLDSDSTPGPGAYDHLEAFKKNQANEGVAQIGSGGEQHADLAGAVEDTPGVGSYNVGKLKAEGGVLASPAVGFPMARRTLASDESEIVRTPGPGAYDPALHPRDEGLPPGHVFGYERRVEPFFASTLAYLESRHVPGPGTYR